MEAWAKMSAPGPEHAMLAEYAGEFTADVQMWMDPAQPATRSKGKARNEMILGGRYLTGEFEGDVMGKPFHGMSCLGYDNLKKKYFSAWIDDMSTGLMSAEGGVVAPGAVPGAGKTLKLSGEMMCPITNKMMPFREVMTFTDDNTYRMEMYAASPADGKEYKSMDITYKRVK